MKTKPLHNLLQDYGLSEKKISNILRIKNNVNLILLAYNVFISMHAY